MRISCHHTATESPGAGCFTSTIWQDQVRHSTLQESQRLPPHRLPSKGCASPLRPGLIAGNRSDQLVYQLSKSGWVCRRDQIVGTASDFTFIICCWKKITTTRGNLECCVDYLDSLFFSNQVNYSKRLKHLCSKEEV